jgi:hypothetical protein
VFKKELSPRAARPAPKRTARAPTSAVTPEPLHSAAATTSLAALAAAAAAADAAALQPPLLPPRGEGARRAAAPLFQLMLDFAPPASLSPNSTMLVGELLGRGAASRWVDGGGGGGGKNDFMESDSEGQGGVKEEGWSGEETEEDSPPPPLPLPPPPQLLLPAAAAAFPHRPGTPTRFVHAEEALLSPPLPPLPSPVLPAAPPTTPAEGLPPPGPLLQLPDDILIRLSPPLVVTEDVSALPSMGGGGFSL